MCSTLIAPLLHLVLTLLISLASACPPDSPKQLYTCLPSCRHLRFVRSLRLSNCTARVHQRLDVKGHFLIEPLLCHNITTMSNNITSVMYDTSRSMYYLKLDIVLIDQITLDVVRSQLADLSPLSVSFMQLWRSEMSVSTVLRNQYDIGRLMVSDDGRSGVVQVYCRTENDCYQLRLAIIKNPENFWMHIGVQLTSIFMSNHCLVNSLFLVHPWRRTERPELASFSGQVLIMQRLRGHVNFSRGWTEYENGFGDEVDFWIGLRIISLLSSPKPVTLRVEMKRWKRRKDGKTSEVFVEYNGFTVGNASTNYRMTYTEIGKRSSSVRLYAMGNDTAFSTIDRDNDGWTSGQCTEKFSGNGGFWYDNCGAAFPTGTYPTSSSADPGIMKWAYSDRYRALKEIRMYLKIK